MTTDIQPSQADLDRRLVEQRRRSSQRHVEFMEQLDRDHQRRMRWGRHYERFKWFYRSLIAFGLAIVVVVSATWGWMIGDLIGSLVNRSRQVFPPGTVITIPAQTAAPSK